MHYLSELAGAFSGLAVSLTDSEDHFLLLDGCRFLRRHLRSIGLKFPLPADPIRVNAFSQVAGLPACTTKSQLLRFQNTKPWQSRHLLRERLRVRPDNINPNRCLLGLSIMLCRPFLQRSHFACFRLF